MVRTTYTIDKFPFHLLRVGGAGKVNAKRSDFGTCHQMTKIESSPGNLEEYAIELPEMSSAAISYYIDAHGKNLMCPSLYLHPVLHPQWATLDEKGSVSHKTSETGLLIEEFWNKYIAAINRECLKIPEDDRIWMMGEGPISEACNEKTVFVEPVAQHPKFPEGHPRAGRRDIDKPKTIDMAMWTQDKTKRGPEVDKKRKFSNVASSLNKNKNNTVKKEDDDEFIIPDTNALIFTSFYDLTPANKRKVGAAKAGEKIRDYENGLKKFIYNGSGHPNASDKNSDIMARITILGPSLNWEINGKPGSIKAKANEVSFTYHKFRDLNRSIPVAAINTFAEETRRKRLEFGLPEESDDEEGEGESKKEVNQEEEKHPQFRSEFEKVNYEEQRDCQRQLKVLASRHEALLDQRTDDSLSSMKLRAVEKEITLVEERQKKKSQELADLQQELDEMQQEEMELDDNELSNNDRSAGDDGSAFEEEIERPTKKIKAQ